MKFQDIIIWILFIISLIVAGWYVFGNSPTFEQAILLLMLTVLIANILETKETKTRLKMLENSFSRLAIDFKKYILTTNRTP